MTSDDAPVEVHALVSVSLPKGTVEVSAWHARPENAWATVVIAHGAGSSAQHPFFDGFLRGAHQAGIATVRFNFAYSQAGRRMPGPAAHAVAAWAAVMEFASSLVPDLSVWAAGKSYGGRMASMAAAEGQISPAGLIYLGYPLHPPGAPEKLRVAHLPSIAVPQLFVSGTTDPFVTPNEQLRQAALSCQHASIEWLGGAGHSFEVKGKKRVADEIGFDLVPLVAAWMRERSA
ncbi:alpha/beta hydrolase family protein (plasmid) [Coraliomargarita sp. W4R53]